MFKENRSIPDNVKIVIENSEKEPDNYHYSSFELTNKELTKAIIYSEILGKPKCKTRRR